MSPSNGPTDVRVTVYDPFYAQVLSPDAVQFAGDFNGGTISYEDTPAGCGAAKLQLGLRYEDVAARGYWTAMNIVEISTGDNVMQIASSPGSSTIYLDANDGFDPALGEDAQLAYFWDGGTLTIRVPVLGIGTDPNGDYITVGAPLGGGMLPAYGPGTIVGRRRYTGQIIRRERIG